MKRYLKSLVASWEAATRATRGQNADVIREMWENAVFDYIQETTIDEYEWCKTEAIKIKSDYFQR